MKLTHSSNWISAVAILAAVQAAAIWLHAAENRTIALTHSRTLEEWRDPKGTWRIAGNVTLDPLDPKKLSIEPGTGILVNNPAGPTVNLLSKTEHGDVEAHVEFLVPKSSNSGVYFESRYEVQILDSWGVAKPTYTDCGGIYQRWVNGRGFEGHAPRVNACKAPGEWQTLDVLFRAPRFDAQGKKIKNARFVKVVLNGQVLHENVEVTGPTRAAVFETSEASTGPLMLQGDHGPVAFRNIRLKPLKLP